jgi:predicted  nucleic acid-binding Zn-ribbon protein
MSADKRAEVTNELIYETLKVMQRSLARLVDDVHDIKERLGILETQVAALGSQYASLSNRLDRMDLRIERIERRLDLVET